LKDWKKRDDEWNVQIERINEGLINLKKKVLNIEENVENQVNEDQKMDDELTTVHKAVVTTNSRLKKVLEQYRRPSKFCMDISLMLILLGLIGVIVTISKST